MLINLRFTIIKLKSSRVLNLSLKSSICVNVEENITISRRPSASVFGHEVNGIYEMLSLLDTIDNEWKNITDISVSGSKCSVGILLPINTKTWWLVVAHKWYQFLYLMYAELLIQQTTMSSIKKSSMFNDGLFRLCVVGISVILNNVNFSCSKIRNV